MTRALRFFRVVAPMPVWMRVTAAGVSLYGATVVWIDSGSGDSAFAALLLWQMLSASRGFLRSAAAGHFDPVLVCERRRSIAVAHLVHSVLPMVAAWAVVGVVERIAGAPRPVAAESGRVAALLFVSAASWALSLGVARLVTGTLWLAGLAALAVTPFGLRAYATLFERPEGLAQFLHAALLAMACPFLMIDVALPMRGEVSIALFAGALVAAAAGTAFICRRSYPLELSS